jgi:metal-responsive CopG/Arc/MetJ family transcriptional regulator
MPNTPNSDELKLEIMTVRVPEGTLAEIDTVLKGGELRSVFIRQAVQSELAKRKKAAQRRGVAPSRAMAIA